jgi:hypothetical protein
MTPGIVVMIAVGALLGLTGGAVFLLAWPL